jgi:hypothetical protein
MKFSFTLLIFVLSCNIYSTEIDEIDKLYACYPIKNIEIIIDYEKAQFSSQEPYIEVCAFTLYVNFNKIQRIYSTRKWRSTSYCKIFMNEWRNLKKDENREVCIAGYLSLTEKQNDKDMYEETGYWEVIKTDDWCHSYFIGNCQEIKKVTESY